MPYLHAWPSCRQALLELIDGDDPWQLALPVCASLAVGGEDEVGSQISAAWSMLRHAANLMNAVQDKVMLPVTAIDSPHAALSCASGLIFAAFDLVNTEIADREAARRVIGIFSEAGFQSSRGQGLSLERAQTNALAAENLETYWHSVILKSGSIFRAGTAAGAAAAIRRQKEIDALGEFGNALGVMRQIHDDCRDIITGPDFEGYEATLPLILYALAMAYQPRERGTTYASVRQGNPVSKEELVAGLSEADIPELISEVLLEWQRRALESLRHLRRSSAVQALELIAELALQAN